MARKITLSVIKADVGGYVGHSSMHEDLVREAETQLKGESRGATMQRTRRTASTLS